MRIGYIVSYYFGGRRIEHPRNSLDRHYYLYVHLDYLNKLKHSLTDIIFCFNLRANMPGNYPEGQGWAEEDYANLAEATEIIEKHPLNKKCKITILDRPNGNCSYGSWDFALRSFHAQLDYTLLVEEDYAPYCDHFDKIFLSYFDGTFDPKKSLKHFNNPYAETPSAPQTMFVCQLYRQLGFGDNPEIFHPAMSNGMINNKIYDLWLSRVGNGFDLVDLSSIPDSYGGCERNQIYYLNQYEQGLSFPKCITHDNQELHKVAQLGPYSMMHIADDYGIPFLRSVIGHEEMGPDFEKQKWHEKWIIEDHGHGHGNSTAVAPFVPIWPSFVDDVYRNKHAADKQFALNEHGLPVAIEVSDQSN